MGPASTFAVVENVEHAFRLMPKLPGWPVLLSGLTNLDGLTTHECEGLQARRLPYGAAPPACGIVTHAGLHTISMPWKQVAVLVRADGGTGLLDLPAAALIRQHNDGESDPLLVVDLDDDHHADLRRQVRQRRRAYAGAGWLPPDISLSTHRIMQFMRSQPKGGRS